MFGFSSRVLGCSWWHIFLWIKRLMIILNVFKSCVVHASITSWLWLIFHPGFWDILTVILLFWVLGKPKFPEYADLYKHRSCLCYLFLPLYFHALQLCFNFPLKHFFLPLLSTPASQILPTCSEVWAAISSPELIQICSLFGRQLVSHWAATQERTHSLLSETWLDSTLLLSILKHERENLILLYVWHRLHRKALDVESWPLMDTNTNLS